MLTMVVIMNNVLNVDAVNITAPTLMTVSANSRFDAIRHALSFTAGVAMLLADVARPIAIGTG